MSSLVKTLNVFPRERTIVQRERAKGSYAVAPYFGAKLLAESPIGALFPALFASIVYPAAGLHPKFSRCVYRASSSRWASGAGGREAADGELRAGGAACLWEASLKCWLRHTLCVLNIFWRVVCPVYACGYVDSCEDHVNALAALHVPVKSIRLWTLLQICPIPGRAYIGVICINIAWVGCGCCGTLH